MPGLRPDRPVPDEVRRVATELYDAALGALDLDDRHEAVHEVRKALKLLRALVRLVRGVAPELYDHVNTRARDTARLVSDQRDAAAVVEALAHLDDRTDEASEAVTAARDALADRRDGGEVVDDLDGRLVTVGERLRQDRAAVPSWELPDTGFDALAGGYAKTYGRLRDRAADAAVDDAVDTWHQWRKRAKYHRHHAELLAPAWPAALDAREDALHDLTDLLGDDHDLAVVLDVLDQVDPDPAHHTALASLAGARSRRLRAHALLAARPLVVEDVDDHVARVRAAWEAAAGRALLEPVEPS